MFKFGYKDYLMLLTYIAICCGDSPLLRTADVIQLNLQNAGADADFAHQANNEDGGKFQMSKAYTYISVTGTADLDLFFMDLSFFADQVKDDSAADAEGGEEAKDDKGMAMTYNGLLGY